MILSHTIYKIIITMKINSNETDMNFPVIIIVFYIGYLHVLAFARNLNINYFDSSNASSASNFR